METSLDSQPLISKVGPISRGLVGVLVALISALPAKVRDALARGVGLLAYGLGIRRKVTLDNLAHAFPERPEKERRAIARGAYVNMARVVLEGFVSDALDDATLERLVEVEGWNALMAVLAEGKGALIATAHFGSWELLAKLVAHRGIPISSVVRPLKGAINAVLVERRLQAGIHLIPPRGSIIEMLKALDRGRSVWMLVDQALPSKRAVQVPFFGRPAATSPGFAMAALRSKVPVFIGLAAREEGRLRLVIEGPIPVTRTGNLGQDIERLTADIAARIEAVIRRYPDQWLWLHRRWKPPRD